MDKFISVILKSHLYGLDIHLQFIVFHIVGMIRLSYKMFLADFLTLIVFHNHW